MATRSAMILTVIFIIVALVISPHSPAITFTDAARPTTFKGMCWGEGLYVRPVYAVNRRRRDLVAVAAAAPAPSPLSPMKLLRRDNQLSGGCEII
nr:hypothetical protein Iba_chr03bCG18660 [Ipomoea batatas]GMC74848.1 hypothetical protein Iba_chr03cCG13960 [Ipomoea batatas]